MPAAAGQIGLDFSPKPTRPARPSRPPRERAVEERTKDELRRVLEARHVGRENAATWERIREEINAANGESGWQVSNVRRLQEAASWLRRHKKLAIGGDSAAGIYIVREDAERKFIAAERVKRIRAEVEELAAFDTAMHQRIAGALPLDEETTP